MDGRTDDDNDTVGPCNFLLISKRLILGTGLCRPLRLVIVDVVPCYGNPTQSPSMCILVGHCGFFLHT